MYSKRVMEPTYAVTVYAVLVLPLLQIRNLYQCACSSAMAILKAKSARKFMKHLKHVGMTPGLIKVS